MEDLGSTSDDGVVVEVSQQKMPDELWAKILESVNDNSVTAFASTCTQLRRVQQRSGRKLATDLRAFGGKNAFYMHHQDFGAHNAHLNPKNSKAMSEDWCLWSGLNLGWDGQTETVRVQNAFELANAAAYWGHLSLLKYWRGQKPGNDVEFYDEKTLSFAVAGGQVEVMDWLTSEVGCPLQEWIRLVAASEGRIEGLSFAHENGFRCDVETYIYAARRGHLACLVWMRENGCPWDEDTCSAAAEGGHLHVFAWARENGCPWNEETCACAAERGHLDVLKYARENGCPWGEQRGPEMIARAAIRGRLDVVQYMHEHGCPWDLRTCQDAAAGCQLEVLRWIGANGFPMDFDFVAQAAIQNDDLEMLKFAREHGCFFSPVLCAHAADGGSAELLVWLRENGCPWDENTCYYAAGGGHLDTLMWARENGCPWDAYECFDTARDAHPHIAKWIFEGGHINEWYG